VTARRELVLFLAILAAALALRVVFFTGLDLHPR
jgi:hypothetical protein